MIPTRQSVATKKAAERVAFGHNNWQQLAAHNSQVPALRFWRITDFIGEAKAVSPYKGKKRRTLSDTFVKLLCPNKRTGFIRKALRNSTQNQEQTHAAVGAFVCHKHTGSQSRRRTQENRTEGERNKLLGKKGK